MLDELDNLEWLDAWYRRQCDGLWEHTLGLNLSSLHSQRGADAASGWRLTIELTGTDSAGSLPRRLALETVDGGWLTCSMSSERFEGAGDALRLEAIIGVFRRWVDGSPGAPLLELETALAG